MYATKALEYLLLNPSERINYRAERGISIKQWYESFKPQPLQGRFVSFQEVRDILELGRSRFFRLKKKWFFGETKKNFEEKCKGYVKVSELNRIIEKESMLVPIQEFYTLIKKEKWYSEKENFDKNFRKYYEKVHYNSKKRYVTISNAAKIICELKKRKEIIEDWPTLEDLNKKSFNLPRDSKYKRYHKIIERGNLKVIKVGRYDLNGRFLTGYQYKIPPHDYHRVLEIEKDTAQALKSGMTTAEIAKIMGLKTNTIAMKIRYGEKVGSLHPIRLCYDSKGFNGRKYALTSEEASLLIERKIKIPYYDILKYREQREILFKNPNNLPFNIHDISRSIEWELWQKIREGDNNAFNILLKLYEPLLNEVASNYVIPWTSQEERRNLLISALFEIVQEYSIRRTKRGDVINLATKKIKERWRKEEAPSWASLDAKLGPDGEDTFLNLLDNQHQLWLKTNSKARHSE